MMYVCNECGSWVLPEDVVIDSVWGEPEIRFWCSSCRRKYEKEKRLEKKKEEEVSQSR